ncbi:methyl-accepting chemotaxis protein [Aneurinibacillus thermoaerophilus]|uniref:methyl-accepting chemotaxis protein n=1 Tax=Aneurinibacillus thermoaerophilus TaxID=143495 RepID=UPI002E1FF103|nr:methyl-accepting chemotaxis protein [Aneurinibacillus thermoaerophilus]MED0765347.1 methyl-accepting chemotaxis protein [Aneurinibacillus thermoaerophilus]
MLRSIKGKLAITFLLIITIPITVISSIVYINMKQQILDDFIQANTKEVIQVDNGVSLYFEAIRENLAMMANNATVKKADQTIKSYINQPNTTKLTPLENGGIEAEIYKEFMHYVESHPNTSAAFLATVNGGYTQYPVKEMKPHYDPRNRPWYKAAMAKPGEVVITDPYILSATNTIAVSEVTMLKDANGKPAGVVGVDVNLENLTEVLKNMKIGDSGYVMMLSQDGTILAHSKRPDMISKNIKDLKNDKLASIHNVSQKHFEVNIDGLDYVANVYTSKKTGWKYISFIEQQELSKSANHIGYVILFVSLGFGVIALGVAMIISSRFSKPITMIIDHMKQIGTGNLTQEVPSALLNRKDEVGILAHSLESMQSSIQHLVAQLINAAKKLVDSSEQLSSHVEQNMKTINQIVSSVQEVATGADNQLQRTEESARAMEEMAIGIQRIAESTSNIAESSLETSKEAEKGNGTIQQAVQQMNEIEDAVTHSLKVVKVLQERATEIVSIVHMITDISSQTNLLALNASIEAARAGEHGRGFAVVADEVRKLAEQSSESADKIITLIQEIQRETNRAMDSMDFVSESVTNGIKMVQESGKAFQRILGEIKNITEQIHDNSAVSEQMSASSEEVTASVDETAQIAKMSTAHMQNVSTASERQLAAMKALQTSSEELHQLSKELNQLIDNFQV